MQDLQPETLTTVVGGATNKNDITTQITTLTQTLKDAVAAKDNGGGSNNMFMMLAMVMAMRPQGSSTVVAAGGPPPVVAAAPAGPVVNISNRVRHF